MFKRTLDLTKIHMSMFLFGPRQVGKTFLIQKTLSPDLMIDLLRQGEFLRYTQDVSHLSREIFALKKTKALVVLDEIQRCPDLLNEVQIIMGSHPGIQFILTGSSARKLKRAGINLLGGRAITLHLHPLTSNEMAEYFSLTQCLMFGSIPGIVLEQKEEDKSRLLNSYIETYLKEEIQQESLTRNIPAFAKFLELAAFENGNIINYQSIAKEIGIDSKTVKEYFQILEDTLIGFLFPPYSKSHRKRIVSHPKFYFFDCGVVSALRGTLMQNLSAGTPPFGRAFEHFVILETKRNLDYKEKNNKISFFRTSDGAEVDMILEINGEVWAIEIKSSPTPGVSDIKGLRSFIKDHKFNRAICVCTTPRKYIIDGIEFLPWTDFLQQL